MEGDIGGGILPLLHGKHAGEHETARNNAHVHARCFALYLQNRRAISQRSYTLDTRCRVLMKNAR